MPVVGNKYIGWTCAYASPPTDEDKKTSYREIPQTVLKKWVQEGFKSHFEPGKACPVRFCHADSRYDIGQVTRAKMASDGSLLLQIEVDMNNPIGERVGNMMAATEDMSLQEVESAEASSDSKSKRPPILGFSLGHRVWLNEDELTGKEYKLEEYSVCDRGARDNTVLLPAEMYELIDKMQCLALKNLDLDQTPITQMPVAASHHTILAALSRAQNRGNNGVTIIQMATKDSTKESTSSASAETGVKAGSFNRTNADTSADETWALLREITRGQNETVAALTNLIKTMTTMPKSSTDGGGTDKKAEQTDTTAAPGASSTADPQQESKTVQDLRKALQLVIDHALETDQSMSPDEYKQAIDKLTEVITKDPSKAASAVEQSPDDEEEDANMDSEGHGYETDGNVRSSRTVPFSSHLSESENLLRRNNGDVFESAMEIVPLEMKHGMYPPGYFESMNNGLYDQGYNGDQWDGAPDFDEWYDENVEPPHHGNNRGPKYDNNGNQPDRRGQLSNTPPGQNGPNLSNNQPNGANGAPRNQANDGNRGGATNRNRPGLGSSGNQTQNTNHGNPAGKNLMRGPRGPMNNPNRTNNGPNQFNNGSNQGQQNYPDRSMNQTPRFGQGYNGQGYNGQGYNGQGYNGQGYNGQGYNGQGYNGQGQNGAYGQYGNLRANQYGPMFNSGRSQPGNNGMPNRSYGYPPNYGMNGQGMGYGNQYHGPGYGNMPNYPNNMNNWANQQAGYRGPSDGAGRNRTVDQYGRHHDSQGKYSVESKKRATVGEEAKSVVLSSKVSAAKRLQAIISSNDNKKRSSDDDDSAAAARKKAPPKEVAYEPLMTRIVASVLNPDKRPGFMGHKVASASTMQAKRNLHDFYNSHYQDFMGSMKHPNIIQQRKQSSYPKDATPEVIEAIDVFRERTIEDMFTEIYSSLVTNHQWGAAQHIGFVLPSDADLDETKLGFQIHNYTKAGGDSIRKMQNRQDVTAEHVQAALRDYVTRGPRTSVVGKYMSIKAAKRLGEASERV